jgi:hypothetical protein
LSLSPKGRGARTLVALSVAAVALSGCGLREESLSDRCGEMMQAAFPSGKIKVTKAEVTADPAGASVTSMIATVAGRRRNVAEGDVVARDVAVECHFQDDILTGFRWTQGPLQPPADHH